MPDGQKILDDLPDISLAPGARLLVITIILTFVNPAPLLITPSPQRSVQTLHPIMGVHTRLTDEVEEWKIQRTLQLVNEMGAPWIVEFFPWAYYAAESGDFAWNHPDQVISHASAEGLTVIARLGLTPDWARPKDTTLTYLDVDAYDDFADYAAAFSSRYADQVKYLIVGNEPNLSAEWGHRQTTASDYADLLRAIYPAVKSANPEMIVLAGALAPTLEPAGSPWGLNDLIYLDEMYGAGAAPFFDGLAVHSYGLSFPPDAEPDPQILNFRRVELVREIMLKHGDEEKSIFITETGWNDHPRWTRAVSPALRIRYTLEAIQYAEQHWPFVKLVAVWAFRYPQPTRSYMDYYTLVTPEFIKKPIYLELQDFAGNMNTESGR
jgi:hypothetical protein